LITPLLEVGNNFCLTLMFLEVLQVKLCQSRKVNLWVRMHGAQLSAGYTVNTHKMVARYTTYQLAKVIVPAES